MTMIAYLGSSRETDVAVATDDLGCGAGAVTCFECQGRGVWDYMEPEIPCRALRQLQGERPGAGVDPFSAAGASLALLPHAWAGLIA
jgi:hypothetical protein